MMPKNIIIGIAHHPMTTTWVRSVLTHRSAGVPVHNAFSLLFGESTGDLQGSVIGPLLFLRFVNVPDLPQGKVLVFADDAKIISPRYQYNNTEMSLHSACDWSVTWDLPLHPSECGHLPIGQPQNTPLTFTDNALDAIIEMAKDMGIVIDTFVKPSLQCREGFSRARAVYLMMRWDFAELTPAIFRPLTWRWCYPYSPIQSRQCRRSANKI